MPIPREVQTQIGEITLTARDPELKVVVHVESTKGEAAAQERAVEPQIPVHFSLCEDSRDQGAKSVDPPSST